MSADNWIAILQVAVVVLTALTGIGGIAGSAIEPWLKVLVVAIGAVLAYVFKVQQPIKAAFQRALNGLKK